MCRGISESGPTTQPWNVPELGRNRGTPTVSGLVEAGALRRLLRGEDVQRGVAVPQRALLFFHDEEILSQSIPDYVVQSRFQHAYDYALQFEHILRARGPFRSFQPAGRDWLGLYSVTRAAVATHKIVFREIASQMSAAPVHGADVIPDHKLHVVECQTAAEVDWLAEVLNSDVVAKLVDAFSVSTSMGGSLLRYVGIRQLSGVEVPPDVDSRLARALGISRQQLRTLRSALDVVAVE